MLIVDRGSEFLAARDLLLSLHGDHGAACRQFRWPRPRHFNWALDFFDPMARGNQRCALTLVDEQGVTFTASFDEIRRRSNQIANLLRRRGLRRGDRLLLMLGNVAELWTTMLAAMKLGCPMIPTTTLMGAEDLAKRMERGAVKAVVTEPERVDRFAGLLDHRFGFVCRGAPIGEWATLDASAAESEEFEAEGPTAAADTLLLYFTSGTTALPKLVEHTHASYPIGHLTTMYWLGVRPGDVHLNLSSPGWAKHAYSSFLAPWTAAATIVALQTSRFDAAHLLQTLADLQVNTFCAPPTVWRSLVQQPLSQYRIALRELLSAGEPLNGEIIEQVRHAWNLIIREGFGQTETTIVIGNFPGQAVVPGSMGRQAPGFQIALQDHAGKPASDGEIVIDLADKPVGITPGYVGDPGRTADLLRGAMYHTGDVAHVTADGLYSFVGRNDDVFKSSDYRISPFELESILVQHPAVQEAAVVPSSDPLRLSVPKAFVVLAPGRLPNAQTALEMLRFVREHATPYMRIRRIEFGELPKTISGKIRRVELRNGETRRDATQRHALEFWEDDFPELRSPNPQK